MIAAVLDTNVLVSGFLSGVSTPGVLVQAWRADRFRLVTSLAILAEVERTLQKPYFRERMSDDRVRRASVLLRTDSFLVLNVEPLAGVATHPEDDAILTTAISGSADYLVTGDRQVQGSGSVRGISIVSPAMFRAILLQQFERPWTGRGDRLPAMPSSQAPPP